MLRPDAHFVGVENAPPTWLEVKAAVARASELVNGAGAVLAHPASTISISSRLPLAGADGRAVAEPCSRR